jgi:hypothetical protein
VLGLLVAGLPACSEDKACEGFPAGTQGDVFVLASCGSDDGDGSNQRPFRSFSRGIAATSAGQTLVLGPGSYRGGVTLPANVSLRGAGAGRTVIKGQGGVGLRVASQPGGGKADAGDGVPTIEKLTVLGGVGAGVAVEDAQLHLSKVWVVGTTRNAKGLGGHGVQGIRRRRAVGG